MRWPRSGPRRALALGPNLLIAHGSGFCRVLSVSQRFPRSRRKAADARPRGGHSRRPSMSGRMRAYGCKPDRQLGSTRPSGSGDSGSRWRQTSKPGDRRYHCVAPSRHGLFPLTGRSQRAVEMVTLPKRRGRVSVAALIVTLGLTGAASAECPALYARQGLLGGLGLALTPRALRAVAASASPEGHI